MNDDNFGDCYIVGKELYIWSSTGWLNYGKLIGPDGKSAYEIAKENGFEGTESEWLDSLKGEGGGGSGGSVNQVMFDGADQKISFVNPDNPELVTVFNISYSNGSKILSVLPTETNGRLKLGREDKKFGDFHGQKITSDDVKVSDTLSVNTIGPYNGNTIQFRLGSYPFSFIDFSYISDGKKAIITPINCEGQIGSADKPFTNGYFKNSINTTSDRNKKENIHYLEDIDSKLTLHDCYDYIKNVYKPATYNLIDSKSSNKKIGIIAQDSENSNVGDLIVEKIDDNYTLNEYAHSSAIGAALKQAIFEIENLKQEIEKLKAR